MLVVLGFGRYVGAGRLSPGVTYLLGAVVVVFLLVSVLLHELGHALVARRYAVGVRGITLEILGGYTEMDRDAPSPRAEAAIALAGPGVSIVLGAVAGAFVPLVTRGTLVGDLLFYFAVSNLLVGVFNVLPGLPLDGGRALRAGIWRVTRDPRRADLWAGWAGRVVAVATVSSALLLYLWLHVFTLLGMIFMIMISGTLWSGAGEAIRTAEVRRRLPLMRAGKMIKPLHLVPSGTPLAEALRQRDEKAGTPASLGISDSAGRVIALVNGSAAAIVPLERRPWVDVDTVASPVVPEQRIPAETAGPGVLEAVAANPGRDLLVTVGEDVIGILRITDVISMLESRGGV